MLRKSLVFLAVVGLAFALVAAPVAHARALKMVGPHPVKQVGYKWKVEVPYIGDKFGDYAIFSKEGIALFNEVPDKDQNDLVYAEGWSQSAKDAKAWGFVIFIPWFKVFGVEIVETE